MTTYLYRNTDVNTRIWPSIQTTDGSTLELGPGDTASVDKKITDPYLQLVNPKTPASAASAEPKE